MTTKTKILLGIVALIISFGIGYFATPTKVVEKQVVKTETVKVEGKTKIVYRDRIVYPDGTIRETEEEREETNTREESSSVATNEKSTTKDSGLTLSALAVVSIDDIKGEREYAVHVSKRVLGALNVSAMATTDKKIGVGLGWSF
jgi:hypothetical protein